MTLPTTPPPEPRRLGDFEIGREIGRGGMGVVYEARQTSLNRPVALKVLSSAAGLTPKAVQRFRREAEAAAKLHHTNIVPIYATGEEGGTHFYAMELIEGPSLDQVIRQLRQAAAGVPVPSAPADGDPDPAPLAATGPYVESPGAPPSSSGLSSSSLSTGSGYYDTVARLIADVADALQYAHTQGVIHRDVKPSNLLLSPAGRLSVNDFGLARMLEQPGVTTTGEMVGTPLYMSPEQITAGRVPVDLRTDIYSLGATLYELLTLQPPFAAGQRDQILAQVMQKEPTPPRTANPKVPVDLETICLKAMDKDPDRRYQTAGQMADDLRRYVNRFAILARRAGPVARLRKWVRRNPALSAALAGVLACAGVAGGLAYRAHVAERDREAAEAEHDAELLEERRRAALEKAVLASRLEDFGEARQAIREAEVLGCSAGQVRMLQGQLALYQGHMAEAADHLTQAVELLPESVAAWGMLAVAHNSAGRLTDYHRALGEAVRLPAVTPEDYLFRGHAESMLDPEGGLRSLDEAVRRRSSSILARLVRTDVLRLHVTDAPDLERARLALSEVQSIRRQLPETATILSLSVSVHLMCYHVFGEYGQAALRQDALEAGLKDARALERFLDSPPAVTAWWIFLKDVGRDDADSLATLRRVADQSRDFYATAYYAAAMYRRAEFGRAAEVLERKRGTTVVDLLRVITLAEVPGGHAGASDLHREVAARDLVDWDLFNSQLVLRLLGRKDEAVEVSRAFLSRPDRFPPVNREPFKRALEYCAGSRSAAGLVASAGGKRGDLCNAHLCIALTALADGDRATARRHLQQCVDTRSFELTPYDLAQMFLSRMDQDRSWPPWIKPRP
ncbi:MAG TPA: protein kinase [Gemmataceae bacterium]|jgi:serine/threonine protein kinase|nr:protein kinase [Gemmataceae bacterium]